MERVPEPEVMEGADQSEAYALADFDQVNEACVERFVATFPNLRSGSLLDLGCGPADVVIRLCRRLPGVVATAVDASEPMLGWARRAVAESGLGDRMQVVQGYVPGCLPSDERFDAIFSNSLLHHMADPLDLWREIAARARPGAAVLVIDLVRPDTPEGCQRIVDQYSDGEPDVLRTDFYHSLRAAYRPEEVREHLDATGLEALQVEVISDRHLAVCGRTTG